MPTPYEKLENWLNHFETEFVQWNPFHLKCQLLDKSIEAGSEVRFYEIVVGLDYDVMGILIRRIRKEKLFLIEFQSDKKKALIAFEGRRTDTSCHFSHTEAFCMTTPVIGTIMNFLIFKVLCRKKTDFNLIRDDMKLDNLHLKNILTRGIYPDRFMIKELKNHTPVEEMEKLLWKIWDLYATIYKRVMRADHKTHIF